MFSTTRIAVLLIVCVYCQADEECKDTYPRCKQDKINCTESLAQVVCAESCGFCGTTTRTTIATTDATTTTSACVDQFPPVCPDYVKNNCTNPLAQIACALSCGYCGTSAASSITPTPTPPASSTSATPPSPASSTAYMPTTSPASSAPEPSPVSPCECPEVCQQLAPLCSVITWLIGSHQHGFCGRCRNCTIRMF